MSKKTKKPKAVPKGMPKKFYLDEGEYYTYMQNGKPVTQTFKNVYISERQDLKETPDFWIPFRIDKATEERDLLVARLMTESIENYYKSLS